MDADKPSPFDPSPTAAPPQGMPPDPLPRGVNGFDFGELILVLARNKLVFQPKGVPEHYTLHLGPDSKIIDFHKTTPRPNGIPDHVRLFSITHKQFVAMMEELAQPFAELLMGLARPLSPVWMEKHRVGAIVGLLPTGAELATVRRRRGRKLVIDPNMIAARAWAPEFIDELYDVEDQIFTLFLNQKNRAPRKIGYGFAVTDARRKRRLVWIPDRQVAQAMSRGAALLERAAAKYGKFGTAEGV